MDELGLRLVLLANIVIPLVFFMAAVYLAFHILFARFVVAPGSPVLWFFGVVTGPLTRPIRRFLAPGTSDTRVRLVALAVYAVLWLVSRALFVSMGVVGRG
jgi:uncharacterized protein YggT (Ycf19 family)